MVPTSLASSAGHVHAMMFLGGYCRTFRVKVPREYTECKYGGPLGRPGTSSVKARLVSPLLFCFDNTLFCFSRVYFNMPSYCCVPNCNQKGYTSLSGEKVSFFNFPKSDPTRKQWIHAIRRDEGKDFVITERTKVCSLHSRPEDL